MALRYLYGVALRYLYALGLLAVVPLSSSLLWPPSARRCQYLLLCAPILIGCVAQLEALPILLKSSLIAALALPLGEFPARKAQGTVTVVVDAAVGQVHFLSAHGAPHPSKARAPLGANGGGHRVAAGFAHPKVLAAVLFRL